MGCRFYTKAEIKIAILTLFLLFVMIPTFAFADTIYLKNGRSVYGKVIKETEKGIHLKVPNGEVFLHHAYIEKIEKDTEKSKKSLIKTKSKEKSEAKQIN